MDPQFWHERWQQGQIGFHQPDFHSALERYWPDLDVARDGRVFVPLCGRSLDMVWLARRGHTVLGIELSPIAAAGFFEHESVSPQRTQHGPFTRYAASGYEILQGDFFDLTPELTGTIGGWYDRAALIALPPAMRVRYAEHMARLLSPGTCGLLITHEYPQQQMAGPPFSVPVTEVHELFGRAFTIKLLERRDTLTENPRFAERGLDWFFEAVFGIVRQ